MVNENFPAQSQPLSYPKDWRLNKDMPNLIVYKPRMIHAIKFQSSHAVLVRIREIQEQEKLRADPRFNLMQIMQRLKRYKAIFAGPPYQPIFS